MPFYVEFIGNLGILYLDDNENRVTEQSVREMNRCLDEIEANSDVTAMISIGIGKHYSLGYDIPSVTDWDQFSNEFAEFLCRLILFPMPTIAALNGHAYGAGAFLALCHDYRVMREDKGYFCLPEAKMGVDFTFNMFIEIIKQRIPTTSQARAIISYPFPGEDALSAGLVHEICQNDNMFITAQKSAKRILKNSKKLDRENLKTLKSQVFDFAIDSILPDRKNPSNKFARYTTTTAQFKKAILPSKL